LIKSDSEDMYVTKDFYLINGKSITISLKILSGRTNFNNRKKC